MEGKWRPKLAGRPVIVHGWRLSHRWDWWLLVWWLLALCVCLAFWVLLGLTLTGIHD